MLSRAQTHALRAVARLALTMGGATACGGVAATPVMQTPGDGAAREGQAADDASTLPGDAGEDALATSDAPADAPADSPASCDLTQPESDASFSCCIARQKAVFAADAGASDPGTLACCNAILSRIDGEYADGSASFSQDYSAAGSTLYPCCRDVGNPMGPACTPWGPPPPPAMPGEEEEGVA
jgi:hypothetical protein